MTWRLIILFILSCVSLTAFGQNSGLDNYIAEGLESNYSLKQKQLDYSISLSRLNQAKSLFFPDLSLNARYTVARGGRVIEFPIGDLLNPVYSTLNMLTASNQFPAVDNQSFNFYRPTEHETKISAVQPIFSSDILYNYRISQENSEIARVDIEKYRRELVREISKAYYNHIKSYSLVRLADSTIILVKENLRVSRKLYENSIITIDGLYRSETELAKVESVRAEAINMLESSRSYLNFLVNRPLEASVDTEVINEVLLETDLESSQQSALASREELEMIRHYLTLNSYTVKLEKGNMLPEVFAAADYGYQGEKYSFTPDDDFVMASLVLRWKLFQGLQNKHRVSQRKIEGQKLELAYSEAEQQIKMEVLNYFYVLDASVKKVEAAKKQVQSALKAYKIIAAKYSQGEAGLLELIDARTSLTGAKTAYIIERSGYMMSMADMVYATGDAVN